MRHILVCVKQVPDPEAAFSMFRVDEASKRVVPAPGLPLVMSPFDEQAVEAALRVRDAHAETRITVVSLGPESARTAIKHGLAMGADDGVLICDPAFDEADSNVAAHALAAAIRRVGQWDLVLSGRQSADRDAGVVAAGIGELLGLPVIAYARDVRLQDDVLRVERVLDDGTETVEAAPPAVVTVSNELGAARKPNLRETMRAARKPVTVWNAADLGLAAEHLRARSARDRLAIPSRQGQCQFIPGSVQEQAAALARYLHEANLL